MRFPIRPSARLLGQENRQHCFISRHPLLTRLLEVAVALAGLFYLPCAIRAQSPLDGFDPKANNLVFSIAVEADGKILMGGSFSTLSPNGGTAVTRKGVARLNPDGTLEMSFNPNTNGTVKSIAVQADGKILIGGAFTSFSPNGGATITRKNIARLNKDGTVDASFSPNANSHVHSIVVQTDGKILIGGGFTALSPNGGAAVTRNRIARLNSNGTIDASFNPNASSHVQSVAVQADGRILIGGAFKTLSPNGGAAVPRNRIARLNPDGTLDSFNPNVNSDVQSITLQADGQILIGGFFTTVAPNGGSAVTRNRIARLTTSGMLDASFNPNVVNNVVYSIAVQADGKILIGGFFNAIAPNGGSAVTRNRIARLNSNGTIDASFNPNASGGVFSVAVQLDGKILFGGLFLTVSPSGGAAVTRNRIARLNADGSLDQTLNLNVPNDPIFGAAVQPDGKILIGGAFKTVLGVKRTHIARLNADGTLDALFNPNANGYIRSLVVQADGKILFGGYFLALSPNEGAAFTRINIARLNPDGTVDVSFDPNPNTGGVETIAVQADGRILIGGSFTTLSPNGGAAVTRNRIARLNPDGTLEASFDPNANGRVYAIVVQADGKILIGGLFTIVSPNGGAAVSRNMIARLNPDGTVDTSFNPNANGDVRSIVIQPDGKILIAGEFTTLSPNGAVAVARSRIARLNSDGTLDVPFDPNAKGFGSFTVASIAFQADKKILIGGSFTTLSPNGGAAVTRNAIARLNSNGTLDTFDPNVSNGNSPVEFTVNSVVLQADGKILIGGAFTTISPKGGATVTRNAFARLSNDTAALQNLTVSQTTITWIRTHASADLSRVTFERSTDGGANYTFLGNGMRVGTTSNFMLTGLSLPTGQNMLIRARGFFGGGFGTGSSITESVRNVYLF